MVALNVVLQAIWMISKKGGYNPPHLRVTLIITQRLE